MNKHKLESELNLDIHNRVVQYVNRKYTLVDEILGSYFKFKYGYDTNDIKRVVANTNNFKLKGFHVISQGDSEYFYDSDILILSVVGNIIDGFTINQVWKE